MHRAWHAGAHYGFGETGSIEGTELAEEGETGSEGRAVEVLSGDDPGLIVTAGERVGECQVLTDTNAAFEGAGEGIENGDGLVGMTCNCE